MKKLLWTVLVTATSAAATALAFRGSAWLWQKVAKEPPPARPRWARLLAGNPVKRGLSSRLHAPGSV